MYVIQYSDLMVIVEANQDYMKMKQNRFSIDCLFATKGVDQDQHIILMVMQ